MFARSKSLLEKESLFLFTILGLSIVAGYAFNQPTLAMWFGFAVAGFSAVSNDSIQTLGTFLTSNKKVPWYWLWLFLGAVLVATLSYGWYTHTGDISYGRLNKIPQPETYSFVQLIAPIVLLVLTRFKMPVSTTFLLLAVFSSGKTIEGMLVKTFTGYFLAFIVAALFWGMFGRYLQSRNQDIDKAPKKSLKVWRVAQWGATAFLWSAWLMQDSANAAVFLPRSMTTGQVTAVIAFLVLGLGFILYRKGGPIQEIIQEKTDVTYVKDRKSVV